MLLFEISYLNLIACHFRDFDWLILTLLLCHGEADCDAGLGGVHLGHVVADVHLLVLAVAVVAVAGLGRAGVDCLLLALDLVVDLYSAGLCVLALLVIDVVADLIVHHLLRLLAHSPHHVHTALTGLETPGLDLHLVTVFLNGRRANLGIQNKKTT